MARLRLDVWSDIACPWCYVGKRRLERALARFPQADEVDVVWRAFELDPGAPKERDPSLSHTERLARKYGLSRDQARRRTEQLVESARDEGLNFDFEHIRSGNMFDAHRLVHLGRERGLQGRVKERFLSAYLEQGELLSDPGTLVRLSVEAGLSNDEAADVLSSGQYAAEVRADEAEARENGIAGVPCFVLGGRYAVSGAQTPEVLLQALQQAWTELAREPRPEFAEGAVCGPDGC